VVARNCSPGGAFSRPSRTIVLHFDTIDNLRGWLDSKERRDLIDKVFPRLVSEDRVEIRPASNSGLRRHRKGSRAVSYFDRTEPGGRKWQHHVGGI
jgi:hypothetical protein